MNPDYIRPITPSEKTPMNHAQETREEHEKESRIARCARTAIHNLIFTSKNWV